MAAKSEWWQDSFAIGHYPLAGISKDWKDKSRKEVAAILKLLKLKPGQEILDVCCGTGRHSIELAKSKLRVTGIDYSTSYIATAKRTRSKAHFLVRDMRKLDFQNQFDAAINLFSSFGYFKEKQDDLQTLRAIYRSLKRGGKFLIDTMDLDWLAHNFVPIHWVELGDGTLVLEKRYPMGKAFVAEADWIFVAPNGKKSYMHSKIRAYNQRSLSKLLKQAGFLQVKRVHPLGPHRIVPSTTARLVLIATK